MCVNNLSKVALDSAAAGIEPATSSRKSNALSTVPPSHTSSGPWHNTNGFVCVCCKTVEIQSSPFLSINV